MPWRLVTGNIIPHPSPSQAPPRRRHGWLWGQHLWVVRPSARPTGGIGGERARRTRRAGGRPNARNEDGELADGRRGREKQAGCRRAGGCWGRAVLANSSLFGGCSEWLHHYRRAVAAKTSTRAPQLNTRAAGAGRQRRR